MNFPFVLTDETQLGGVSSLLAASSVTSSASSSACATTTDHPVDSASEGEKHSSEKDSEAVTKNSDKSENGLKSTVTLQNSIDASEAPKVAVAAALDTLTTPTISSAGQQSLVPIVPAIPPTNWSISPMQPLSLNITSSDSPTSASAASLLVDLNVSASSVTKSPPALALSSKMTNLPSPPSTPPSPLTPNNPNVPRPPKKRYLQQALVASLHDVSILLKLILLLT